MKPSKAAMALLLPPLLPLLPGTPPALPLPPPPILVVPARPAALTAPPAPAPAPDAVVERWKGIGWSKAAMEPWCGDVERDTGWEGGRDKGRR